MSQEPKELYSLLIPLKGERLLVPRMCVAEVIAFADAARDRRDDHPDWFLGTIEWNGQRVPVVSFDDPQLEARRSKRSELASSYFTRSRKSSGAVITAS